ncbi:MAG: hypothetical protein ACI90V_007601 [Bacillariaceae sp.]|jgi:hypothetical protein
MTPKNRLDKNAPAIHYAQIQNASSIGSIFCALSVAVGEAGQKCTNKRRCKQEMIEHSLNTFAVTVTNPSQVQKREYIKLNRRNAVVILTFIIRRIY